MVHILGIALPWKLRWYVHGSSATAVTLNLPPINVSALEAARLCTVDIGLAIDPLRLIRTRQHLIESQRIPTVHSPGTSSYGFSTILLREPDPS